MKKPKLLSWALIGAMTLAPLGATMHADWLPALSVQAAADALGYYAQTKPDGESNYWRINLTDECKDYVANITEIRVGDVVLADEFDNDDPFEDVYGYTKSSVAGNAYIKINKTKLRDTADVVIKATGYQDVTIAMQFEEGALSNAVYTQAAAGEPGSETEEPGTETEEPTTAEGVASNINAAVFNREYSSWSEEIDIPLSETGEDYGNKITGATINGTDYPFMDGKNGASTEGAKFFRSSWSDPRVAMDLLKNGANRIVLHAAPEKDLVLDFTYDTELKKTSDLKMHEAGETPGGETPGDTPGNETPVGEVKKVESHKGVTITKAGYSEGNGVEYNLTCETGPEGLYDALHTDGASDVIGYAVNGKVFKNKPEGATYNDLFLYEGVYSTKNAAAITAYNEVEAKSLALIFKDKTYLEYSELGYAGPALTQKDLTALFGEKPADAASFELASATVEESYGSKELILGFTADIYQNKDFNTFYNSIETVQVNGQDFPFDPTVASPLFLVSYKGMVSSDEAVIAAAEKQAPVAVKITTKDGKTTSINMNETEEPTVTEVPLTDELEDGEYTIGFSALYGDGREGHSMLEGFFDKNVKLTVKNGVYSIEMLNVLFAHGLYDFRIEKDGAYPESVKTNFGEPDINGNYNQATFKMPISEMNKIHDAGVLVGYMGSLETDKGKLDKYTKLRIEFSKTARKGWEGFIDPKEKAEQIAKSDEVLNKRLKESGADLDGDGTVTAEELQNFSGALDISGSSDVDKIYNIDLLKNMGPNVTSLNANGNRIEKILAGLFDGATGLTAIELNGNNISELPAETFANNKALKKLRLAANPIGTLPEGLLKNSLALEELELGKILADRLPADLIRNLSALKNLYLDENELSSLDPAFFETNTALEKLHMNNNRLQTLPESMTKLTNLRVLDIRNNDVAAVPEGIENLTALRKLDAANNRLTALPEALWRSIASHTPDGDRTEVKLSGNYLREIPYAAIQDAGGISVTEVALNLLPSQPTASAGALAKAGITPTAIGGYMPQKTEVNLESKASAGDITVTRDLDMLLTTFWANGGDSTFFGGEGINETRESFDDYVGRVMTDGVPKYMSDTKGYIWHIVTTVEKKVGENFVPVARHEISDAQDPASLTFKDPRMKKGDVYRTTRTIFTKKNASATMAEEFSVMSETTADADAPNQGGKETLLKAHLQKVDNSGFSMANDALITPVKKVEKADGTVEYEVGFRPIQLMGMNGHLLKLYYYPNGTEATEPVEATILETMTDNGKVYPKTFLIPGNATDEPVRLRVRVDAMEEILSSQPGYKPGDAEQDVTLVFDGEAAADKSALNDMIEAAKAKLAAAGWTEASAANLSKAIDEAVRIASDPDATAEKVDAAVAGLQAAMSALTSAEKPSDKPSDKPRDKPNDKPIDKPSDPENNKGGSQEQGKRKLPATGVSSSFSWFFKMFR
ncbi:MAG: NEAT domain-containing protein [Eubacteriales bacterium]|nr:NEAT domain-containing protein [Eubacteriales bacterium]